MDELPVRYGITVTVDRDGARFPDPGEFAAVAALAASGRAAGVMSAHTAEQIISVVTVNADSRPAAVAVALAVVSEALKSPSPTV